MITLLKFPYLFIATSAKGVVKPNGKKFAHTAAMDNLWDNQVSQMKRDADFTHSFKKFCGANGSKLEPIINGFKRNRRLLKN